jgi:hypothetical protein
MSAVAKYNGPTIREPLVSEWKLVEPVDSGYITERPKTNWYSRQVQISRMRYIIGVRAGQRRRRSAERRYLDGDLVAKRCNRCLRMLLIDDFYHNNRNRDGYGGHCKKCNAEMRAELRHRHPIVQTRKTPCRKPEAP